MTTFWRKNPVNPGYHSVTRTNWDKSSWADLNLSQRSEWLIRFIHSHDFETTKSLLVPNATCPECGDEVYFFKHYNGGCAWFDDIPWPWPKHKCMDIEGTKCSAEWIAEQDEAEKEKQTRAHRKQYIREHVEVLKAMPFAKRFFTPVTCETCDRDEYEFELSDSTIRRFTDFGSKWRKSKCTLLDDGTHKRAQNAEYLDDFLNKGGKWKTSIPSKIFQWGAHYGTFDNISMYLSTDESIFTVENKSDLFSIPTYVVHTELTEQADSVLLLESLVFAKHQVLIKTGNSKILEDTGLVFLRGRVNDPSGYNISYLCMNSGRAKTMKFELLSLLSISEYSSLRCRDEYSHEALEDAFALYNSIADETGVS